MKKLFSLKKWLTLDEAARHLTIVLGEDVCVADVLRLTLDGHLKMSFNFVNHVKAKKGRGIPIEEASYHELLPTFVDQLPNELLGKGWPIVVMNGTMLDEGRVLELENQVITLDGVYDLSMLGPERLDVEHRFQILTNGPPVTLEWLSGPIVIGDDGFMYQLQESFEQNQFQRGSAAQRQQIDTLIASQRIDPLRAMEMIEKHRVDREAFSERVKANRDSERESDNYYPAGGLPADGVFVVRTDALRDFELSISDKPSNIEKPLTTTERTSLLLVIAAFCENKSIDTAGRDAVGKIRNLLALSKVTMDDGTIRKILDSIPDAIERRMK